MVEQLIQVQSTKDAFVKDVKVEKVGDKYQYTIQVKKKVNLLLTLLRNKPFTVSKLTYKGLKLTLLKLMLQLNLKKVKS